MQKRNFSLSYLLLLLLGSFSGTAQNYTIKESAILNPDFLHEFFQIGPDRYLALDHGTPVKGIFWPKRGELNSTATQYDKTLRRVSSAPIKELAGKKYIAALESHHRIVVFYSDAQKTVFSCELDGGKGALLGKPEELFSIPNEYADFIKGFSPDSAYCYLLCKSHDEKGKDKVYHGAVMDKEMNVVTKFSFVLEGLKEYVASDDCVLSNEGLLHVMTAVKVKSSRSDFRPLQYLVTDISTEGKSTTTRLDNLPEGLLSEMKWSVGEKSVSFTCLLAKTKKTGFTDIVTGEYEGMEKKASGIKETGFSSTAFFQNASAKYLKELAKDGIPAEIGLVGSYTMSDRSVVLIFEKKEIRNSYSSQGGFAYTDAETGNLYIVKINPQKELDWVQVIPTLQQEPTFPIYTGIISMADGKDGVFIFYHDEGRNIKKEAGDRVFPAILGAGWRNISLAAIHIGRDGSYSKKFIIDDSKADLYLAPAQPFIVYDNELIYTSYHLGSFSKSTYRIGTIKIN